MYLKYANSHVVRQEGVQDNGWHESQRVVSKAPNTLQQRGTGLRRLSGLLWAVAGAKHLDVLLFELQAAMESSILL